MASVDLTVSEEEATTFNYENRPIWPRVPTPCNIPACGTTLYTNFKSYIIHWKKIHEPKHVLYICSCGRRFETRKHINSHLKKEKSHSEMESQLVRNWNFVDTENIPPYQYGTAADRQNMKEVQKFLASKRRREEAEKFRDVSSLLCNEHSSRIICRDEIVKERGRKIVKDTNMWDSPNKRRRISFK